MRTRTLASIVFALGATSCSVDAACPGLDSCAPPAPSINACAEGLREIDGDCEGPVDVSIGFGHLCTLWSDGRVACSGRNVNYISGAEDGFIVGRPKLVEGLTDVVAIGAGRRHTCAVIADGGVRCWGENESGVFGAGNGRAQAAIDPVSIELPAGYVATKIYGGPTHTCTLDAAGEAFCWGSNEYLQLGRGVTGSERFESLSLGWRHTCGLHGDGTALCWGAKNDGSSDVADGRLLGPGESPVRVDDVDEIAADWTNTCMLAGGRLRCDGKSVAPYPSHEETGDLVALTKGCAVGADGRVHCWWPLQFSGVMEAPAIDPIDPARTRVVSGRAASCMLTPGAPLECWGVWGFGIIEGDRSPTPSVWRPLDREVVQVDTAVSTCARTAEGELWCWGGRRGYLVGDGRSNGSAAPVVVLRDVVDFEVSSGGACAVTADGRVHCWGGNDHGVADWRAPRVPVPRPRAVEGVADAVSVRVLGATTCALRRDDTVVCWGSWNGLHDGPSPFVVPGLPPVAKIDVFFGRACAAAKNGEMWCWGNNDRAQFGSVGQTESIAPPFRVQGIEGVVDVAVAEWSQCGLLDDNSISCSGINNFGELGTHRAGGSVRILLPPAAEVHPTWKSYCARLMNGETACWGQELQGAFGSEVSPLEPEVKAEAPVTIPWAEGATGIAHAAESLCVIREGGVLECRGPDYNGNLSGRAHEFSRVMTIQTPD